MNKNKKVLLDDFCAAVAKLHVAGWSNDKIIRELTQGRYKHDVPDALEQAKELGFLTKPELVPHACEAKGVSEEQIDAVILGANLTKRLQSCSTCLCAIHIFYPSGNYAKTDFDGRLAEYAPFAARHLADTISRTNCRTIGVSWGLSPRVVIDALARQRAIDQDLPIPLKRRGLRAVQPPQPTNRGIVREVFPVCGLPLHRDQGNQTANENAAQLHEALNGSETPFKYEIPLNPALVPKGAEELFQQLLENFSPGYKEVFGSGSIGQRSGGLVENADLILTSVSAQNALGKLFETNVTKWAKIGSLEELLKRVDGDIAGVLLRKKRGSDPLLDEFDRHWTGITRADIERCARRAQGKSRPSPGMCVVAIGENKAAVVLKCLLANHESGGPNSARTYTGLISHLICDYDLAMKLMDLTKPKRIVPKRAVSN